MPFVKGPDFPTGALMMGRQGILDAYRTGRGSIRLRAVAEIEEGKRNDTIVVSKLPYQVSPTSVLLKIKELVDSGELDGIADINNASAGEDGPSRDQAQARRAGVSSCSTTSTSARRCRPASRVNTVALIDGVPRTLNLRPGPAGLRRPPGRRHPPPHRVPPGQGQAPASTSSRACSRRST